MGKMTRRAVVLAALCTGALAALLAFLYLNGESQRAARAAQQVLVVVTTRELPVRTVIGPGMVRESHESVATLPANCATSVQEVMGRVTTTALAAGEPVQRSAISVQTASLGLAYVVPEGMRAVTVALDPIIGVAGFLKAGDRVDVVATFAVDTMAKTAVTRTVLQDVELLAIGPEVVPEEENQPRGERAARPKNQPNATLVVTPDDAEKLILAESKGTLRLTLRRAGDAAKVWLAGVRSDTLVGVQPARERPVSYDSHGPATSSPAAKAAPEGKGVETIRGTKMTKVEVRSE